MSEKLIYDYQLKHFDEIRDMMMLENEAQIAAHGVQYSHIFEWGMWTAEEFGEFIKEVNEFGYARKKETKDLIHEGIQTMTLIAKIISGLIENEERQKVS